MAEHLKVFGHAGFFYCGAKYARLTEDMSWAGLFATKESDTTMHGTSKFRQWFLEWLDGDNGQLDAEAVAKLKDLCACTDELPAGYCQHGKLRVPFGVSYGVAAQKILGNKDWREMIQPANRLADYRFRRFRHVD